MKLSETSAVFYYILPGGRWVGLCTRKGKDIMVRSLVGFAGFAIVALLALKMLGAIFGFAISIIMMLLWLAFWGFIIYLILRIFAPGLADRVRNVIRGNKTA